MHTKATKTKIKKWNYVKLKKNSVQQRKPSTKGKDEIKWEKIITYPIMLISKIYKQFTHAYMLSHFSCV